MNGFGLNLVIPLLCKKENLMLAKYNQISLSCQALSSKPPLDKFVRCDPPVIREYMNPSVETASVVKSPFGTDTPLSTGFPRRGERHVL
jgi:hypothetical protein